MQEPMTQTSGIRQPVVRSYHLNRKQILQGDRVYWYGRRLQDIVLSLLALILLAPVMGLIALLILIDSPGASPVFSQTRVGRDGKTFKFYNLRWMEKRCMAHKEIGYFDSYVCAL